VRAPRGRTYFDSGLHGSGSSCDHGVEGRLAERVGRSVGVRAGAASQRGPAAAKRRHPARCSSAAARLPDNRACARSHRPSRWRCRGGLYSATPIGFAPQGRQNWTNLRGLSDETLQELWTFNIGTGINAPAISFAVNGKQYIAVLPGSAMREQVLGTAPELRNNSTASMLFVFTL
jgi:hypothetical protein